MAVYAIGDLHLSLSCDKPMDIFPGWQGYVDKLATNWRQTVQAEDTVVLAGDTSWAMKLEDTHADFTFLQGLPGHKLLLKGNHDYWWSTVSKMERYTAEHGFYSIGFLFNNSVQADGMALCGTRSWMYEPGVPQDAKVMAREAGRLRASLEHAREKAPGDERVVFLHYPPLFPGTSFSEVIALLKEYGVGRCFYGHLHGATIKRALQGVVDGIAYNLISADALAFSPRKIQQEKTVK